MGGDRKMKMFDTCLDCEVKLKKTLVDYRGTKLEALQCPKCKQKIFTEEQVLKAINSTPSTKLMAQELHYYLKCKTTAEFQNQYYSLY